MAKLRVTQGKDVGREYEVGEGETILGRIPEVDVQIHDVKASRRHTRITGRGGVFQVEDLESRNGTRVNGRGIVRIELRHDDVIAIGKTELTFVHPAGVSQRPDVEGSGGVDELTAETETLERAIPVQTRAATPAVVVERFDHRALIGPRAEADVWGGDLEPAQRWLLRGGLFVSAAVVAGLAFALTQLALG